MKQTSVFVFSAHKVPVRILALSISQGHNDGMPATALAAANYNHVNYSIMKQNVADVCYKNTHNNLNQLKQIKPHGISQYEQTIQTYS